MVRRISRLATIASLASLLLSATAALGADETWQGLFDGKSLGKWKVTDDFDFKSHGKVEVKNGAIVLHAGRPGTAIRLGDKKIPKLNYEIALEAMRVEGEDFFCGLTFPVGEKYLSLIVGGWGGRVVGLSCIDGEPAAENETCQYKDFENKRWYAIRLRVTKEKVEAWIDKERIVDFALKDHELTVRFEPESVTPMGIATWRTTAALRNIRLRRLQLPSPDGRGSGEPR